MITLTKIIPAFLARHRRSTSRASVTCAQLARQGRWDQALCCKDCHGDQSLLIAWSVTDRRNPLKPRRHALLCCACVELIDDWFPGQLVQPPEHEN